MKTNVLIIKDPNNLAQLRIVTVYFAYNDGDRLSLATVLTNATQISINKK